MGSQPPYTIGMTHLGRRGFSSPIYNPDHAFGSTWALYPICTHDNPFRSTCPLIPRIQSRSPIWVGVASQHPYTIPVTHLGRGRLYTPYVLMITHLGRHVLSSPVYNPDRPFGSTWGLVHICTHDHPFRSSAGLTRTPTVALSLPTRLQSFPKFLIFRTLLPSQNLHSYFWKNKR